MTTPSDPRPEPGHDPDGRPDPGQNISIVPTRSASKAQRRREKIVAEIQRNRRGEFTVPTWVLAAALGAVVLGWLLLIFLP